MKRGIIRDYRSKNGRNRNYYMSESVTACNDSNLVAYKVKTKNKINE